MGSSPFFLASHTVTKSQRIAHRWSLVPAPLPVQTKVRIAFSLRSLSLSFPTVLVLPQDCFRKTHLLVLPFEDEVDRPSLSLRPYRGTVTIGRRENCRCPRPTRAIFVQTASFSYGSQEGSWSSSRTYATVCFGGKARLQTRMVRPRV